MSLANYMIHSYFYKKPIIFLETSEKVKIVYKSLMKWYEIIRDTFKDALNNCNNFIRKDPPSYKRKKKSFILTIVNF